MRRGFVVVLTVLMLGGMALPAAAQEVRSGSRNCGSSTITVTSRATGTVRHYVNDRQYGPTYYNYGYLITRTSTSNQYSGTWVATTTMSFAWASSSCSNIT